MNEDLTLALELADIADRITTARVGAADLRVEHKPDRTLVTEADQAAEEAIRARLAEARPDDAVVGEEYGTSGTSARRWVIDPIDGTNSYVRGIPTWSTLIALQEDEQTILGVCSMPAVARRWWATRGGGAFADGRPIQVSGVSELADAQMLWSGIEDWDAAGRADAVLGLLRSCWRTRGVGDAWQYMMVAEGLAEIATDPQATLWDLAVVQIVLEEAGGRFSDLRGNPTADGGSALGTNGHLHEVALERLRE